MWILFLLPIIHAQTCSVTTVSPTDSCNLCNANTGTYSAAGLSTAVNLGRTAAPGATTMNLNSLTTGPTTVGSTAGPSTFRGSVTSLTGSSSVTISAPTVTIAPGVTSLDVCNAGSICSFGTGATSQVNVGAAAQQIFVQTTSSSPTARLRLQTSSTAPVVSGVAVDIGFTNPAGAPSLTTSSRINLGGRYHTFYWGKCLNPTTSPTPLTLICNVVPPTPTPLPYFNTNAAVSATPTTSGYDTTNNFWYPPEVGHYFFTVSALGPPTTGLYTILTLRAKINNVEDICAQSQVVGLSGGPNNGLTASCVLTFNTVGANNYVYAQVANGFNSATPVDAYWTTFSVFRVA